MADEERSFDPNTASSNRAQMQGPGAGHPETDKQQPRRAVRATDPDRAEPFDRSLDPTTKADGPEHAAAADAGRDGSTREAQGDLGVGVPANVDVHDLGQEDKPQDDWGAAAEQGTVHSADHTRRPVHTEAERGQGAKTRRLNKDIVSRRT